MKGRSRLIGTLVGLAVWMVGVLCCSVTAWAGFHDNGNGTVSDSVTGLMWQQGDGQNNGVRTWEEALGYCENLSLGGQSDWRLPNVRDLETLVDWNSYEPTIDTTYFPNCRSSGYWSSSPYAYIYSDAACYVFFGDGGVKCFGHKSGPYLKRYYVRCVRGGPGGSFDYSIIASAGTGGSISPSDTITVTSGGSQTFTITANNGYQIFDVKVDGTSQGAIGTYIFTNVTQDHSISATFAAETEFILSFPLPNRNPGSAVINSVFDHSMSSPFCPDSVIVAYTGEEGRSEYGQSTWSVNFGCGGLYGFKNSNGSNFLVNGNYSGGGEPNHLFYDGHPAYDYRTTDQDPDGRINVLAAADGVAYIVSGSSYNTIYIDHGNGYKTYYLHLYQKNVTDGQSVTSGQVIGISGDTGSPGAPHLHFEIRKNVNGTDVPVDPYGWTGSGSDPYTKAASIYLWVPLAGCPDCSGANPTVHDVTFTAGTDCTCTGDQLLTIGPNVLIEKDAKVTFKSPKIVVKSKMEAKEGSFVKMIQ